MSVWIAVLGCAAGCYLLKLAGLSVPSRVLDRPAARRVSDLMPVALLAALVAVQVLGTTDAAGDPRLALDARLAGLGAAVVALLLRAPFIVVVAAAAGTAAVLRLL